MIESTGAFDFFSDFLERLRSKYDVRLAFVYSPLALCLKRIKGRSISDHLRMSDSVVNDVYNKSNKLEYNYVLKIDNSNMDDNSIINAFKRIL